MGEVPEQVEAAEQSVAALHSTSTSAKLQLEVQQTPSDGEQAAELVLVHGVLPSGWPVFGTQQSAWQSFGSEPQSHSSQPSTTELPHTPCTGFTLQQPRLLATKLHLCVSPVNDNCLLGRSCAMASRLHCESCMLAGRKPRLPFSAIRCSPSGPGGQEDAVSCGAPKLCATYKAGIRSLKV